jgi:hypothetical protein
VNELNAGRAAHGRAMDWAGERKVGHAGTHCTETTAELLTLPFGELASETGPEIQFNTAGIERTALGCTI